MSSHIYALFCFVFKNCIAQLQIATHSYICSSYIVTDGWSLHAASRRSVTRAALKPGETGRTGSLSQNISWQWEKTKQKWKQNLHEHRQTAGKVNYLDIYRCSKMWRLFKNRYDKYIIKWEYIIHQWRAKTQGCGHWLKRKCKYLVILPFYGMIWLILNWQFGITN